MMTIWWANKITAKDQLHVGQDLVIPPVTGLVVTVKAGDTLDSIAAANKLDRPGHPRRQRDRGSRLIVGQVVVLPGAKGAPIPTPKPTEKPVIGLHGRATGDQRYRVRSVALQRWAVVLAGAVAATTSASTSTTATTRSTSRPRTGRRSLRRPREP